jgi:hypothetical protein
MKNQDFLGQILLFQTANLCSCFLFYVILITLIIHLLNFALFIAHGCTIFQRISFLVSTQQYTQQLGLKLPDYALEKLCQSKHYLKFDFMFLLL